MRIVDHRDMHEVEKELRASVQALRERIYAKRYVAKDRAKLQAAFDAMQQKGYYSLAELLSALEEEEEEEEEAA